MDKPIGVANSQFYVRSKQHFAVEQSRYRHDQAMYSLGELAMFVLMWKLEDHLNGYVRRCPRCFAGEDKGAAEIYDQPTKNQCPMCYGTTFEGGVRAKVIRPAIFTDTDDNETTTQHGMTYPQNLSVQSTSDFRFRAGDYVFRADGSRWQLASPQRLTVRTGFGHPSQTDDSVGYGPALASLEDTSTVAWMIPPNKDDLVKILQPQDRYPRAEVDVVNGPLIPVAWTD